MSSSSTRMTWKRRPEWRWLSTALASSSAPWQVLVFHHPVYSCGKHGSALGLRRELLPIVAIQGVDLVVNGRSQLPALRAP